MPSLATLIKQLGIPIQNERLIKAAVTHSSFRNESLEDPDLADSERLEFLGDSILNYLVGELVYQRFPDRSEGQLTELRAALVRTTALADLARSIHLEEYLRLTRDEESSGARKRDSLLADTFEALVAAIYLDGGLELVKQAVMPLFEQRLNATNPDALLDVRSILQERIQGQQNITPHYVVVAVGGVEHRREFTIEVYAGQKLLASGKGHSKQAAAQAAARMALHHLDQKAEH